LYWLGRTSSGDIAELCGRMASMLSATLFMVALLVPLRDVHVHADVSFEDSVKALVKVELQTTEERLDERIQKDEGE